MITDTDVKKLKQVFATKKDLDRFATKDDLNEVKKDVKELKKDTSELKKDVKGLKEDNKGIKELMADIASYIKTGEATMEDYRKMRMEIRSDAAQFKDEILHELIKVRENFAVVTGWGDKIEDHEERIEVLEKNYTSEESRSLPCPAPSGAGPCHLGGENFNL